MATKKSTAKSRKAPGKSSKKSGRKASAKKASKKTSHPADSDGEVAIVAASDAKPLGEDMIRIRMYRVGFGDCFLVSLPAAKGSGSDATHFHILVDCGVHSQGNIGTMGRVVDNIGAVTGKKLTAIIATHAHQDHISGYDKFGDAFSSFDIEEVWLPWTWDPDNKKATKLQKKQLALTDQLVQHFSALAATSKKVDDKAANAIENLKGNAHAIALLKSGFGVGARVRYLKAGDSLASTDAPKGSKAIPIPGLSVMVLGPPESDEFLAQMDPPAGQRFLRMVQGISDQANKIKPFTDKWLAGDDEPHPFKLPASEEKLLQDLANFPLDGLAFALDKARNNESLVTLLVFRGQYLLFPGDAQYGNWRWWLENLQPDDILPRISFFKVAHHGSENATPRSALERMSIGKFAAMVSTQSKPWGSIPRVPLMESLDTRTQQRIVRSDWLDIPGAPKPSANTAPPLPSQLPKGFSQGELWFDYLIKV